MIQQIAARGVCAELDPAVGHIPRLVIGGADVLHAAPWRAEPSVQSDRAIPLVDRRLGGCFLTAPFGRDDVTGGPPHGPAANTRWLVKRASPQSLHWRLAMSVRGARIDGTIWVEDGVPALYQRHVISGGAGAMTFAYHPMVRMAAGGTLRCAPKRAAITEPAPQAPGAAFWAPGQRVTGWILNSRSGAADLRAYPQETCEDFVTLVEAAPDGLGWTALHRHAEDDTILILKRCEDFPVTMLWVSNGGRDFAPWNGRHRGVLGIEDGICAGGAGFAAAAGDNAVTREGRASAVALGGRHVLRHATLRLPGARLVADVRLSEGLEVLYEDGGTRAVPFDTGFFA